VEAVRDEPAALARGRAAVTGFLVAGLAEYNFGDAEVVMVLWAIMALPFTVGPTEAPASSAGRDPLPSGPSRSTA